MTDELTIAGAPASQPRPDERIVIFARGVVDNEKRPEFLRRAAELRSLCLSDPGTLAWSWFTDRADPSTVWMYEEYADDSALDVHRDTVRPLLRSLLACFAEPLVAHRCVPLTGES